MSLSKLWDKFWKDSHGRIAVWQMPNAPLIVWLACAILQRFWVTGHIHSALGLLGFGALFTWAWLEVFSGLCYFRRLLGLVVLVALVLR